MAPKMGFVPRRASTRTGSWNQASFPTEEAFKARDKEKEGRELTPLSEHKSMSRALKQVAQSQDPPAIATRPSCPISCKGRSSASRSLAEKSWSTSRETSRGCACGFWRTALEGLTRHLRSTRASRTHFSVALYWIGTMLLRGGPRSLATCGC